MKQLIKNLKAELQLREAQIKYAKKHGYRTDFVKGQIYGLKTAIIFAEEGVNSDTIVRFGKK